MRTHKLFNGISLLAALALMLVACEAQPPQGGPAALPDVYLERLQEAEAAGRLDNGTLKASMKLEISDLGLEHVVEGEIAVE